MSGRSILYVGPTDGTSRHRAEALSRLGNDVVHVGSDFPRPFARRQLYRIGHRLRRPPDLVGTNRAVLDQLRRRRFDLLWVDKGLTVRAGTLRRARDLQPHLLRVSYSPDDMMAPELQSRQYLQSVPVYDLHVTTKSFNVAELPTLGALDVLFVDNAYDPLTHRPVELTEDERQRFEADVGFIGSYERERAEAMLELARRGISVTVHGGLWEGFRESHRLLEIRRRPLLGLDYARGVNATKINLGFLRKAYRDQQTTRSVEIPACGGFLLAERTDEHRRLFEEGVEAEFFDSTDELVAKVRHYLEHPDERARVAAAGRQRCLDGGYSNDARLETVLDALAARGPAWKERRG